MDLNLWQYSWPSAYYCYSSFVCILLLCFFFYCVTAVALSYNSFCLNQNLQNQFSISLLSPQCKFDIKWYLHLFWKSTPAGKWWNGKHILLAYWLNCIFDFQCISRAYVLASTMWLHGRFTLAFALFLHMLLLFVCCMFFLKYAFGFFKNAIDF